MAKVNKEIKPVNDNELPPEFKKFDKPFGLEQHVFNIIIGGIIPQPCLLYYVFYLWPFGIIPRWSLLFEVFYGYMSGIGTTVGSHRYWTHKTFKANRPLQILLMLMHTSGMQYPIFKWCRDHRVHHKYTDTDADPHNATRGFWFSHITWLFLPKHEEVKDKMKIIDMSDLARDPVVRFQSKYYWELVLVTFFIIPMGIYHLLWPEMSFFHILVANFTRYGLVLHGTFLVNSVAHKWGNKPYDKYISATDNKLVSFLAAGEGWHNYHHAFPWDYKSSEYGYKMNLSTIFIHFFAMIGWAWDLKTVSHKLLVDRINRTGDRIHPLHNGNNKGKNVNEREPLAAWGWGDPDVKQEDIVMTETIFPRKRRV